MVCKLVECPLPTKCWDTMGGGTPNQGEGSPQDQPGLPSHPSLNWGLSNVFLLYKNRSKCCLLFLPEAKLLLYFLELLIVNLRVLREAKYIPLVNEEINLFKSCTSGSSAK